MKRASQGRRARFDRGDKRKSGKNDLIVIFRR
jgi:hypothetical protein